MYLRKTFKYAMAAVLVGLITLSPVTNAIVAATGESQEELAEKARQERVAKEREEFVAEATSPVNKTVAGVKSDVDGYYMAKKVQGVALKPTTPESGAFVKVMDADVKKSTAAYAVAQSAAQGLGGTVGPCINVYYGKMVGGVYTAGTDASAGAISIGIPANFRTEGAKYSVVAVYAGGASKVYDNVSTDPNVITVNVDAAQSPNVMYAVVKH
ncbi:MAG: hypothetical protein J5802_06835 [Butyrivibrio sp.]|nr:hypothetical protein [Butyrivibrio sp.]